MIVSTIVVLLVCYILLFLLSLYVKDNSIVDLFWGIGFGIITFIGYSFYSEGNTSEIILLLLVEAWSLRLFLNILAKKWRHLGEEDYRYKRWREKWKYFRLRSFFQVYLFQGLLMLIIATPIFFTYNYSFEENTLLLLSGSVIALVGLLYQSRADGELAGFIVDKKRGDILTSGLRRFHRYPQYFGESVFWFGISVISLQVSIFGLTGWFMITFLLLFVSGVPLIEARYMGQKNYEEYSKTTPILIPNYLKIFDK